MIPPHDMEATLLTLMFTIGLLFGSALTVAIHEYQRARKLERVRRHKED